MLPDKNKMVSVILERMGSSSTPKTEDTKTDKDVALQDAMRKFLKAIKYEDVDSMVNYLKDFVYLCHEDEPKKEETEGY